MLRRRKIVRFSSFMENRFCPSMRTLPEVGVSRAPMQFSRVLFIEKKLPAIQPGFFGFQCRLSFIGGLIPFDTGQPVTDNAVNVCLGEQLFALSPAGLRGGAGGLPGVRPPLLPGEPGPGPAVPVRRPGRGAPGADRDDEGHLRQAQPGGGQEPPPGCMYHKDQFR